MTAPTKRLGHRPRMEPPPMPDGVTASVTAVKTADDASAPGILYTVEGATTAVTLMHPRQDLARHHLIPALLEAGFAVWAQGSRTVNNDLTLIHEEAVLDAAAGFAQLRDRGFEHIVACGPSGGAALYAFYVQQASRAPDDRIRMTPGGKPIPLDKAIMPVPDAVIFLAAHPGQGELLLGCIDGAVADESDPLSTVAELDIFDEANGFREPPASSQYPPEFLARYREAQRSRVERIDAHARYLIDERMEAKERFKTSKRAVDRRAGVMSKVITVYRTDADPRTLDLSLDPSERPYGSIHGRRPDLINFGVTGFGRLTTADAWLSTWSGLSSNAGFVACAPEVTIPSLFIEYTGDQATFPSVAREMFDAIGATDKAHERIVGTHFGGSPTPDGPPGGALSGNSIVSWLRQRVPSA
ncbi:hypothetical protein [Mycobacterium nebraskense]|uniref:Alpha/beta hydrolase n=1 Tax=Mycobacterium nebraskense TaxID=244292 RepID=A0A1X1ZUH5_9MYCO|nr:hypothetical protein [Mycobacterium nebraskense]KKC06914.1 alpha/beta hydrolase family protein [Mycobacterium nebraskense]MBI2694596.1 alpha/beta hydrolase [Mycobacterium nebraskense]MCV7118308.1 alpha/beta hydrolase [Mycobacterium nebraskense]ORW27048.1 alpha/beta hydrolase [Mycobacterium nebraskense]